MKIEFAPDSPGTLPKKLLPWHKPELQQLVVTLDTGFDSGSGADGLDEFEGRSDRRLKKDIARINDALDGILALHGVTFRYDTANYPGLGLNGGPQIGFIAQDLEQVFPQLVKTREDGFKTVNYAQLVPVLVEAIKQQQSMIADLQAQVSEMQRTSVVSAL